MVAPLFVGGPAPARGPLNGVPALVAQVVNRLRPVGQLAGVGDHGLPPLAREAELPGGGAGLEGGPFDLADVFDRAGELLPLVGVQPPPPDYAAATDPVVPAHRRVRDVVDLLDPVAEAAELLGHQP